MKLEIASLLTALLLLTTLSVSVSGRNLFESGQQRQLQVMDDSLPYMTIAVHNIGKIALTISNYGVIGRGTDEAIPDPLTGANAPSMSYPKGFGLNYLFEAALWVGGVVGRDTLVSTAGGTWYEAREFWPERYPEGDIVYRSTKDPESPEFEGAVSQQDFIATYADTITDPKLTNYDYYSERYHKPLGVKITQKSYAWGYDYAEDFVIFDCEIANINMFRELKNLYIGIFVDNDIGRETRYNSYDDICGFMKTVPSRYIAGLVDTIDIAWAADNDGDPDPVSGDYQGLYSPTGVAATRILRTPADSLAFNFNWWVSDQRPSYDWGPRKAGTIDEPFRSFNGYLGSPVGDRNKYYIMRHKEFDYNQWETHLDHTASGWLPPPDNAEGISDGQDIKYLLSFGPFNLGPGDVAPFTFAIIGGQNFHYGYNFADVGLNALWAEWIFDNPGVDTDGDNYKGRYHTYCYDSIPVGLDTIFYPHDTIYDTIYGCLFGDTIYYKGDGVPDFKGAAPPPSPKVKLFPEVDEFNRGQIRIRWNGRLSETSNDQFSQKVDFEGYRIYYSITGRPDEFTLVTSFDYENYDRWEYNKLYKLWEIINPPYRTEQLRWMYGENFDPDKYFDRDHLFAHFNWSKQAYEFFFFTKHDWNITDLTNPNEIHKVYPDQPYPSTLDMDSAAMFFADELTEDGELKYFEYEYTLKNLLPSQPYYVAVTAFDQGFPGKKLAPLESQPHVEAQRSFALPSSELATEKGLDVIVYPNPYRIDGHYRERFEGWERPDLSPERTRAIHFINLPNKCTIRIFSLDGDLIREIKHDFPPGSPESMHETWDLITRNTMMAVSGIYYYSVESELGNYIGKLAIIK
jgi:hypothetical protein